MIKKSNYGDIEKFIEELKKEGYKDIKLIDTTRGIFIDPKEAKLLGLSGSKIFIGRK